MTPTIQASKQALRQQVAARLQRLTASERAAASAKARELLAKQPLWQRARSILFFAPLPGELDVWPLLVEALAAGKTVALPRFEPATQTYSPCRIWDAVTDLENGQFGIREPNARCAAEVLNRLDFILVPGVAYDEYGRRLGRGRGFYDRLLGAVRGLTCGVAFDEQLVSELPVEPHDRHLDCILTPTRWRQISPRAVLE